MTSAYGSFLLTRDPLGPSQGVLHKGYFSLVWNAVLTSFVYGETKGLKLISLTMKQAVSEVSQLRERKLCGRYFPMRRVVLSVRVLSGDGVFCLPTTGTQVSVFWTYRETEPHSRA